ncbi:hypothetical protein BDA99DRAFT_535611 [Phascolomyces articulosus]|uniref:Uncharacterized protein n=1 Tax=Phascolomyces articulosus TaxID=60185 RepID=A0AAD5KDY9_9FUNG|nr:hypothetical protein BDA99DRAFT_535611 [Phascolomyces articulosus]
MVFISELLDSILKGMFDGDSQQFDINQYLDLETVESLNQLKFLVELSTEKLHDNPKTIHPLELEKNLSSNIKLLHQQQEQMDEITQRYDFRDDNDHTMTNTEPFCNGEEQQQQLVHPHLLLKTQLTLSPFLSETSSLETDDLLISVLAKVVCVQVSNNNTNEKENRHICHYHDPYQKIAKKKKRHH